MMFIGQTPRRRGNVLIEPYKQLRFGVIFLLLNILFSLLVLIVFGQFLIEIYEAQMIYFRLDGDQANQIAQKLQKPIIIGAGLLLGFVIATLFFSARYTHAFYGPLVSIKRFLEDLKEGKNPEPIKLRSSDQLKDLVEQLNDLSERVLKEDSLKQIERFLDDLVEGKRPKELSLGAQAKPLQGIKERLDKLAASKK